MLCVWGAYPVGYVPSTTWLCDCQFFCYAKLASEAQAKAVTLGCISLALTTIPCDELGKALLCKSEGYPTKTIHAWFHALAVICDVQEYQPVGWRFAAKVLMLSCYCLPVSCRLLLACPSPPGLAPSCPSPPGWAPACLLCTSWLGTTPPCHLH
jgi:hypothetical protein